MSQTATVKFDSAAQEVYLGLWRTYDRLRTLEDRMFAERNLTAQQYNVLRLLRAAHPEAVPTLSLISRLVSLAPDITRMLDRLELSGWVLRERSQTDRRTVMVKITDEGISLLNETSVPLSQCHEAQLGHMSADELGLLSSLLAKARFPHEPVGSLWKFEA